MKYVYYVVFVFEEFKNIYGSIELHVKNKLDRIDRIQDAQKHIQETYNVDNPIIISFTLLRTEDKEK